MKTKENKIGNEPWKYVRAIFTIVIIAAISTTMVSASTSNQENKFPDSAPLQNAIKQAIAEGNFSADDIEGTPEYNIEILEKNESHIKFKANTRITFKNPKGAGYGDNIWPKFEIEKTEGNIKAGDYDKQIKDSILSDIKNIKDETERSKKLKEWNNYDFEYGSRTYEFSEIYDVTYPNESADTLAKILNEGNYNYDILMGFTKNVYWTYSREANLYIFGFKIAWARVDAVLNAALGLRLPTNVGLSTPDTMIRGQSYTLDTNIDGRDWDAAKYSAANVLPENGNEFVARGQASITVQAWARIIGNIGPYYLYNKNFDYGRSFKTPFGPYQEFPIPELYLSPDQTGLKIYYSLLWAGVGLKIDPDLGSDKITANWNIGGDAIGSGLVEYRMPNTNYYFGPVMANDYSTTTDYANIKLSDYNYYFTVCRLTLGANVQAGLTFIDLKIQSGYIDIYNYNCGDITGGLRLGVHQGTTANSVTKDILVDRITVLSPNGGENWIRGTTQTIRWRPGSNAGPYVKLDLLKNGMLNSVISSSTPNDGSYIWTIPPGQTLGSDYKVRITSTSNSLYWDASDSNFIVSAPVNLLKNPGFEEVYNSMPKYWNKYQTGTKAIFTYPEIGRTGTGKSVAIKYSTIESGKVALWQQTGITVYSGKQYKLSGYMKLAGVTGGGTYPRYNGASLRINWYRSDGSLIKVDLITKSGTIGWAKYEKIFTAPSNAVKATVGGDLFNVAGKVWLDDISFVRVS